MIERTEEEVVKFLTKLYEGEYEYPEVEANECADGWILTISKMYDYVPHDYSVLRKIAEFFNTMNINSSMYARGGCETCDYGSNYTVELYVKEGDPFPEIQ